MDTYPRVPRREIRSVARDRESLAGCEVADAGASICTKPPVEFIIRQLQQNLRTDVAWISNQLPSSKRAGL